jgi:anti-sigma-K factor RskA
MSTQPDRPDIHLLVGGYALDALDPAETALFEPHLRDCPSCLAELPGLLATTAELATGLATDPPASLRAAVRDAAATTPQLAPTQGSIEQVAPERPGVRAPDGAGGTEAGGVLLAMRRRRWAGPFLAVAAAVLVVIAGGLGWRAAVLSSDLDQARVAAGQVSAVLTAPDATTVTGSVSGGGRGAVVSSVSLNRAVIVTQGMSPPPPGKVYQLWYLSSSGTATSAGFLPTTGGDTAQTLHGRLDGAAAVGVSVEPVGGSPAPTTTPILAVKI